jgi:hypothetical protein
MLDRVSELIRGGMRRTAELAQPEGVPAPAAVRKRVRSLFDRRSGVDRRVVDQPVTRERRLADRRGGIDRRERG